jgi:RHS repeat-associated protein
VLPCGRSLNTLYYGSGHAHQINLSTGTSSNPAHQLISDLDRDALHRETGRSQGSLTSDYAYDPQGRLSAQQARRTQQVASQHQPTLAKSAQGKQSARSQPSTTSTPSPWQDGAAINRRYHYDAAGNLLQQQDWTRPTTYAYDPLGQLLAATGTATAATGTTTTASTQERFAFDPAHNLLPGSAKPFDPDSTQPVAIPGAVAGTGVSTSTGAANPPSSPGRVQNNRVTVFEDKRFTYDTHGRVTQKTSGSKQHLTELTLMWDDEHQLITAKTTKTHDGSQTKQTTAYQYDAFGRRISKAGEFGQTRFLWDGNRLLQERRSNQSVTATQHVTTTVYEPESFVPLAQLAWTENAQPTQQTQPQQAYAQRTGTHDGIIGGLDEALAGVEGYGASNSKDVSYINNSQVQADTLSTARLTSSNTSTLNHPPATINYYHCDQIGTPRELTDEQGAVTWSATYKAWGKVETEHSYAGLSLASSDGEITKGYANAQAAQPEPQQTHQPLRFQGQYYDVETGLHYNRFRYYEPETGFYISEDPIALAGGTNTYRYVLNPLAWVDPLGLAGNKPACPICCDESTGRSNKQARLLELASDPKQPAWVRGWIKNELRHIATGNRNTIRLPGNSRNSRSPGKELAHGRGTEAKDGYCYLHSLLQDADLHKLQHKIGGY